MAVLMALSPEELALVEAGAFEEVIESEAQDIDELAEALAVQSIVTEEQHSEIMRELSEWRQQWEVLSPMIAQLSGQEASQNPTLERLLTEMGQMRGQLESLRLSMDSIQSNLRQSQSTPLPEPQEVPDAPNQELSTVEPSG